MPHRSDSVPAKYNGNMFTKSLENMFPYCMCAPRASKAEKVAGHLKSIKCASSPQIAHDMTIACGLQTKCSTIFNLLLLSLGLP